MEYFKTYLTCPLSVDGIYTVHYFEYTKDFAYSGEMHNFWELVYADKKNLLITAGAKEVELEAGQIYIHKPNEFHNIRCDGKRAANSVIISFDCDSPELFSVAGQVLTADEEERKCIGNVVKEASSAFSTRLSDPYISVMEKAEDSDFCCEQLIRLNIEMLLISLIRSNKNKKPLAIKKNSTILAEITDYLSENVEKKVVFYDVVKKFNLSPSVLKKIFREQVGCGVMDYFTRLKIDRAKEMIREEKYNFTEISERLEFNKSQYFTTDFKRVSGMTPSEYAKSIVSKSR
ncbi:MAG: helix-turn-helix transcriptional regulator [Clostridia bacterium]|nr:helix-turn-helix transcriptional regulator [Clostridia bacterium]